MCDTEGDVDTVKPMITALDFARRGLWSGPGHLTWSHDFVNLLRTCIPSKQKNITHSLHVTDKLVRSNLRSVIFLTECAL